MQTLDLKQIIAINGLKPVALSRELFPDHKEPYKALHYVVQGKRHLDSEQIAKLAEIVGVSAGQLFTGSWCPTSSKGSNLIQFNVLGVMAELNTKSRETKVYQKSSSMPLSFTHDKGCTLSAYLEKLTNFINIIN